MEDLLQGNKTINHSITTTTPGDEQKKYKITRKNWLILWKVEVQSRTKRGNIFILQKIIFFLIFFTKSTYTRKLSNPSFSNGSHINLI
jgi:hypothetical protein